MSVGEQEPVFTGFIPKHLREKKQTLKVSKSLKAGVRF